MISVVVVSERFSLEGELSLPPFGEWQLKDEEIFSFTRYLRHVNIVILVLVSMFLTDIGRSKKQNDLNNVIHLDTLSLLVCV